MYTKKILTKFNMENCNPISIPSDNYYDLSMLKSGDGTPCDQNIPYREAVGSLLFLSMTLRPDITFAANNVSEFCADPRKILWNAVKRIFRYLKGTLNMGIKFSRGEKLKIVGYADADFAGEEASRKSTSGYILKLGTTPVTWASRRQKSVALSTAEFVSACLTITNLILESQVDAPISQKWYETTNNFN